MSAFWEHIIDTATLGTARKQLSADAFPPAIAAILPQLQEDDPESTFLAVAAVAMGYRQAGIVPLADGGGATVSVCASEQHSYCSDAALQSLYRVLEEKSEALLQLWLSLCAERQCLIPPIALPSVLNEAVSRPQFRTAIMACAGERGQWLIEQNDNWKPLKATPVEEQWETGTIGERARLLYQMRKANPQQARERLQSTWESESAQAKVEFLHALRDTISDSDRTWLEGIEGERSKKVKEEIVGLLRRIPTSAVVQQYAAYMMRCLSVQETRTLGIVKKKVLAYTPHTPDAALLAAGIEELSSSKEYTDEEFWLYQVLGNTPPALLEQHLQHEPATIIELFQKTKGYQKFVQAIAQATVQHRDTRWARELLAHADTASVGLIAILPEQERETFLLQWFYLAPADMTHLALQQQAEWSIPLAQRVLAHTCESVYQYNRGFYRESIGHIPVQLELSLRAIEPKEAYQQSYWQNTREELRTLLMLKQSIQNALQP